MNDDYVKRSDVHKAFQPKYAPAINRVFATMIDSVPAADVVEVVRCGDCIRKDICRTSNVWAVSPDDNWFCADGERKDGGQDA